jgi:hypothetical protein
MQSLGSDPAGLTLPLNGLRSFSSFMYASMPPLSRSRKRSTASANAGCASQWADHVRVGRKPRAILCSPWAPPVRFGASGTPHAPQDHARGGHLAPFGADVVA